MHCCATENNERRTSGVSGKNANKNTQLQLGANKQATTSERKQPHIHHWRHQLRVQSSKLVFLSLLLSFIIQFNFQRLAVTSTARCELIVYLFNQFNSSGGGKGSCGLVQLVACFRCWSLLPHAAMAQLANKQILAHLYI